MPYIVFYRFFKSQFLDFNEFIDDPIKNSLTMKAM